MFAYIVETTTTRHEESNAGGDSSKVCLLNLVLDLFFCPSIRVKALSLAAFLVMLCLIEKPKHV